MIWNIHLEAPTDITENLNILKDIFILANFYKNKLKKERKKNDQE